MAIQPVQSANPHTQAQPTALPQKPAAAPAAAPQDQVTISQSAKQALANSTKSASGK
jgi:hypothetical protein